MKRSLLALTALLPAFAFAHAGGDHAHGSALFAGFSHPFTGLDHMAAMIMVGVWSMLTFRHNTRAALFTPAAFAGVLLIGGLLAFAGVQVVGVEPMIAASLLVLGLLVGLQVKLSVSVGAAIAAAFALFHGLAHGAALPAQQALTALTGMMAGTLTLHLAGMALARFALDRSVWLPRLCGAAVALFGFTLLAA